MNGKGDTPRPVSVPADEYERRWRATFGAALNAARDRLSAEAQRCIHGAEPLDVLGTMPQIASHEPDPSGGRNSVT